MDDPAVAARVSLYSQRIPAPVSVSAAPAAASSSSEALLDEISGETLKGGDTGRGYRR